MPKSLCSNRVIKTQGDRNGAISKEYSVEIITEGNESPGSTIEKFANVLTIKDHSPSSTCASNSDATSYGLCSPTNTNGHHCKSEAFGDSNSTSNGDDSESITHRNGRTAITTGNYCTSISLGKNGIAICCGIHGRGMIGRAGLLGLRSHTDINPNIIMGKEGNEIHPYVLYELNDDNEFIPVVQENINGKYKDMIISFIEEKEKFMISS